MPDSEFSFKANYIEVNGIKTHFIDEGNSDSPVIFFLHGVPTWSFTFRKIFPLCLENGFRVIAPDLPGFGKTEKPSLKDTYSLQNLTCWVEELIRRFEYKQLFLFAHDWGAVIGMNLAARNPRLFSGIIVCNGFLPLPDQKLPLLFILWQWITKYSPYIPVACVINMGCSRKLSKSEKAGYNFPFLKEKEKTAVRVLPRRISESLYGAGSLLLTESWNGLQRLHVPFLTVFSDNDPITRGGEKVVQTLIPGARNQPHRILQGRHFLQEDKPEELGRIICKFVKNNVCRQGVK